MSKRQGQGDYHGGSTVTGSSAYFAGWGAKGKQGRRAAVGLAGMMPAIDPENQFTLIKCGKKIANSVFGKKRRKRKK